MQIRWRDIDRLGHLNQSVYHEFLEEARAGLLLGLVEELGEAVTGSYVVAHVDLDYRTEVRKDHEQVDVTATIERVGSSSVTMHQEIRLLDGTVAASGATVIVGWDTEARRKRVLSDAERTAFGVA
jgi:acyl-CoA thioester hydrolase